MRQLLPLQQFEIAAFRLSGPNKFSIRASASGGEMMAIVEELDFHDNALNTSYYWQRWDSGGSYLEPELLSQEFSS